MENQKIQHHEKWKNSTTWKMEKWRNVGQSDPKIWTKTLRFRMKNKKNCSLSLKIYVSKSHRVYGGKE